MQYSLTDDSTFPSNVTDITGNLLNSTATFTNSGSGDFSLQSTSACIDNGNPSTANLNLPFSDVYGNDRIDNSIIDMGAAEFQQSLGSDNKILFDLIIYPNPTEDIIYVTSNEILTIQIFSIDGKALGAYKTGNIDLSNFGKGVYIFKIENSKGEIMTRRILKK